MPLSPLVELLKLPAGDRAELAMALWESLTDADREETLRLTEAQRVEFDRRWREHIENPASGQPVLRAAPAHAARGRRQGLHSDRLHRRARFQGPP